MESFARTLLRALMAPIVVVVLAAACGKGGDTGHQRLEARLAAIETRLAALENRGDSTDPLSAAVKDVERRLAAIEAERARARPADVTSAAPAPLRQGATPSDSPATAEQGRSWAGLQGPEGEKRRAAIMALGAEYKARVAKVRAQYGEAGASPESDQAMQEVQQWYAGRLRALMTGAADSPNQ